MVTNCRLPRTSPCERRDHILAIAAKAFSEEGYGATSMSTIAARVGGSKATLYKYFPSKRHLFEAVMEQRCERILAPLRDLRGNEDQGLESLLTEFGERFLSKIYEPAALDIHRLIHSEGARFPELAVAFFQSGPNAAVEELCATLTRFAAKGQIVCSDLMLAAGQFLGMLRGDRHLRFAAGLLGPPERHEILYHAKVAARIFIHGVQPRQEPR